MLPPLFLFSLMGARAAEPITYYCDFFPSAQFAGVYAAIDQGFYREVGLDLTIKPFAFGQKPVVDMDLDPSRAAVGTMEGYIFLQRRAAGMDIKAYTAVLRQSPAGFMSLASAPAHSARDFVGKRVGIHTYADPIYRWFLKRAGIPESAAPFVFVKDDVTMLSTHKLDVMQGYAVDELVRLRRLVGGEARFVSFADLGFDAYSQVVYATAHQARDHNAAIRAFIVATRRGWGHALAHPESAADSILRRLPPGADRALQLESLAALRPFLLADSPSPLGGLSPDKWARMEATLVDLGLLKVVEPPSAFLASSEPSLPAVSPR